MNLDQLVPEGAIVTVTPNPCMDRTATLSAPLEHGGVNRVATVTEVAAGKGINVALATLRAGKATVAVAPAPAASAFATKVDATHLPFVSTPTAHDVRTNLTILDGDGTTTKVNEPGHELTSDDADALAAAIVAASEKASWIVLAGSLPPGLPSTWYADMVKTIRSAATHVNIAVDTSDGPLKALGEEILKDPACAPDLLKPNGLEIGQMLGLDGQAIEDAADAGNFAPAAQAATQLVAHGVTNVLLTLGGAGAVLATKAGAWAATPPPITPVSTVGAGDSSLAGFLIADSEGAPTTDCLARAVAYGSAATSLPGTTLPHPEQTHPEQVQVTELHN